MRHFLIFLSSLFTFLGLYAQDPSETEIHTPAETKRYSFQLEMKQAFMSGILLTNYVDGTINGSLVNEFGISALSFTYLPAKNKIKLIDVVGFLNKWYIKAVLKNDIKQCVNIIYNLPGKPDKNYEITQSGPETSIYNKKRKIRYTFSPLQNT